MLPASAHTPPPPARERSLDAEPYEKAYGSVESITVLGQAVALRNGMDPRVGFTSPASFAHRLPVDPAPRLTEGYSAVELLEAARLRLLQTSGPHREQVHSLAATLRATASAAAEPELCRTLWAASTRWMEPNEGRPRPDVVSTGMWPAWLNPW